jgi:hypothetical protein
MCAPDAPGLHTPCQHAPTANTIVAITQIDLIHLSAAYREANNILHFPTHFQYSNDQTQNQAAFGKNLQASTQRPGTWTAGLLTNSNLAPFNVKLRFAPRSLSSLRYPVLHCGFDCGKSQIKCRIFYT